MASPLSDLLVLDLSRVLAGPWASQTLADLGAEVIKIEKPGSGDDTRSWGPPYAKDQDGNDTSEAAYFLATNRGKKSVTVDMTTSAGQKIIREIAGRADVLIENFKVGALARYGLDYETLSKHNPKLIYCSITGFGQNGPYHHLPGYDPMIQGLGGFMSINGVPDGQPGAGPMKTGVALTDILSGLYAVIGILAAVNNRTTTGQGEYIDISLLDVQVSVLANQAMNYLTTGQAPSRHGNAHPNIVPFDVFETADGHVMLTVGNDDQFQKFCAVTGLQDAAQDERFKKNRGRVQHREILVPVIREVMRDNSSAHWIKALGAAGVPCGPINTIDKVFDDPQVQARKILQHLPHPLAGEVPSVASPLRLRSQAGQSIAAPPTLGQHTEQVLSDLLGHSETEIAALREQHVI